jgi:hypothetical protein
MPYSTLKIDKHEVDTKGLRMNWNIIVKLDIQMIGRVLEFVNWSNEMMDAMLKKQT